MIGGEDKLHQLDSDWWRGQMTSILVIDGKDKLLQLDCDWYSVICGLDRDW